MCVHIFSRELWWSVPVDSEAWHWCLPAPESHHHKAAERCQREELGVSFRVSPGLLALEVWGYNRFSLNSSVWVAYVSAALVGPGPGLEIMKRYEATGI